jgi:hypothetical protein
MSHADRMELVCPDCGCHGSIATFATHSDADAVAQLLGAMPPDVAAAMQRYVRLFAPPKHDMTWRRARKVLEQIAPLIAAQRVTANGRDWPAPHTSWIAAVNGMLDSKTVQLPLKSNGYIVSILVSSADKTEAQAERAGEEARRTGAAAKAAPAAPSAGVAVAQVRTATAMLVAHATTMHMKYQSPLTDDEARYFLSQFSAAVADAAIAEWKRRAK